MFVTQEFVPPEVFKERGESAMQLLDSRIVATAYALRKKFGPMVINNWHIGGEFTLRGFRPADTNTGAKWSQHKFGRAIDCHFTKVSVEEVRLYILAYPAEFPYITCVELGVTWLHFDSRNHTLKQQIMTVTP